MKSKIPIPDSPKRYHTRSNKGVPGSTNDPSLSKFQLNSSEPLSYLNLPSNISIFQGDIMKSNEQALCHSVSSDLKMSQGLANIFTHTFKPLASVRKYKNALQPGSLLAH